MVIFAHKENPHINAVVSRIGVIRHDVSALCKERYCFVGGPMEGHASLSKENNLKSSCRRAQIVAVAGKGGGG